MKRFLITFALTAALSGLVWHAWREQSDTRLALEAFQPGAPRAEAWRGGPARAIRLLVARWDAAPAADDRLECLGALATLARAGEPAAFAGIARALDDPDPGVRRTALFAAAWVFQPGARSSALSGVDWDDLCRQIRPWLDAPDLDDRYAGCFAFHTLTETRIEDLHGSNGRRAIESEDAVEALARAMAAPPPLPGLEASYPAFLARCFYAVPIRAEPARRFVEVFRAALARTPPAPLPVVETMFAQTERLPDDAGEAALVAALESPLLAAAALPKARRLASPAFLPAYLRLLADPEWVAREEVARQVIELAHRRDDHAVGLELTRLRSGPLPDHALPVVLRAILEVRGPVELEPLCPADLAALSPATAVAIAGLLGSTGHGPFLDRLIAAVHASPEEPVRTAALAAAARIAAREREWGDRLSAVLAGLVDREPLPVPPGALLAHLLAANRADLSPAIERLVARERDPLVQADLLDLRRPGRLRNPLQEALAPVWAQHAISAPSRRVQESARTALERFEFPPEAAPLATRLGHVSRSDREQARADLRWIGSIAPAEAAELLGDLLERSDGGRETCQLLRALARLPADERTLLRARMLLASHNGYVTWRAAMLLLRHERISDPAILFSTVRTHLTSPLPGESYAGILHETVAALRRHGLLVRAVPPNLASLLRQGAEDEVEEARQALLLIGSREAAEVARQTLADRVAARTWSAAARVLGEIGDRADLDLLVRALRGLDRRYGPEDLERAYEAFLDAAECMARPEDVPSLVVALDEPLPASAATRLIILLEGLSGNRYEGDLSDVRRAWRRGR